MLICVGGVGYYQEFGKKLLNFFLEIQLRFLSILNIGTELVKILDSLI